jgi:hypothetical protein
MISTDLAAVAQSTNWSLSTCACSLMARFVCSFVEPGKVAIAVAPVASMVVKRYADLDRTKAGVWSFSSSSGKPG